MSATSIQDAEFKRENRFVNRNVKDFQDENANPIEGYETLTISTLEEAVERIIPIVPRLSDYVTLAKQKCKSDSTILTLDESAAIYLYTMQTCFHIRLNGALRAKDRHELKPWFGFLKLFITALNKLPSIQTVIWRGVSADITFDFFENDVQIWWSVNSCTKNLNVVNAFISPAGTLFTIQTINGKDIHTYSAYKCEEEVILLPGTRLRIKAKLLNHENSLCIVHLEEENSELVSKIQSAHINTTETPLPERIYPDSSRYQGELKDGKRHGYGVYYYLNGEEYAGEWRNDQTNGRGIRIFRDGSRYEGMEKNGKRHGYGTYYFPNEDIYDGEWVDDEQDGIGIFIMPNGIQYQGHFRNNLRHGHGKVKYADGKIKEGYWKRDKFIH